MQINYKWFKLFLFPNYEINALWIVGPDTPTVHVMNAHTSSKVLTLDVNSVLADKYASMARPQIKIFQVEMEFGYNAQVRLMLPPGFRENEEMSFPLILKV